MKEFIATFAGLLTTLALIPQVIKILRTHKSADLSLPSFAILGIAFALWFVYGLIDLSFSMMFATAIAALSCLAIVHFIIKSRVLPTKY